MKNVFTMVVLSALLTLWAAGQDLETPQSPAGRRDGQTARMRQGHGGRKAEGGLFGRALQNREIAEKLGLSEEQRDAIREQVEDLKQEHIELKERLEAAAMNQARLMTADDLDESALMAAVEETGRIHTQQAKLRVRHLLFMRRILEPEQAEALRNMMRARRGADHDGAEGAFPERA